MTQDQKTVSIWKDKKVKKRDHDEVIEWLEINKEDEYNGITTIVRNEERHFVELQAIILKYFQGRGMGEFILLDEYTNYIESEDKPEEMRVNPEALFQFSTECVLHSHKTDIKTHTITVSGENIKVCSPFYQDWRTLKLEIKERKANG